MHSERCPVCKGKGKVEAKQCHGCGGKGWITVGDPVDVRPIFLPIVPACPGRYYERWVEGPNVEPQVPRFTWMSATDDPPPGMDTFPTYAQEIPILWQASKAI